MNIESSRPRPDRIATQRERGSQIVRANAFPTAFEDHTLSLNPDVKELGAKALASPEIRGKKVGVILQAVARGRYWVEPSEIAEAILQEAHMTRMNIA